MSFRTFENHDQGSRKKGLLPFLLVALVGVFALDVPAADAGFQVTLSAGGSSTTIIDGGAGDLDGLANNGIINISTIVDGYSFNVTLATTNTPGGAISFVSAGTNQIIDIGGGPTIVSIYASANNFTSPVTPPDLRAISGSTAQLLSGTPSSNTATVSYQALIDNTNTLSISAAGTVVGSGSDGLAGTLDNTSLSDNQIVSTATAPYALNLLLSSTFDQAGSRLDLDGSVQLEPVPEPSSFLLLGSGLVGLGLVARRRRLAKKA